MGAEQEREAPGQPQRLPPQRPPGLHYAALNLGLIWLVLVLLNGVALQRTPEATSSMVKETVTTLVVWAVVLGALAFGLLRRWAWSRYLTLFGMTDLALFILYSFAADRREIPLLFRACLLLLSATTLVLLLRPGIVAAFRRTP